MPRPNPILIGVKLTLRIYLHRKLQETLLTRMRIILHTGVLSDAALDELSSIPLLPSMSMHEGHHDGGSWRRYQTHQSAPLLCASGGSTHYSRYVRVFSKALLLLFLRTAAG